jgi:hypothetical protein
VWRGTIILARDCLSDDSTMTFSSTYLTMYKHEYQSSSMYESEYEMTLRYDEVVRKMKGYGMKCKQLKQWRLMAIEASSHASSQLPLPVTWQSLGSHLQCILVTRRTSSSSLPILLLLFFCLLDTFSTYSLLLLNTSLKETASKLHDYTTVL